MSTDSLFTPPSGPVQGWRDGPVTRATGIPYATSSRFAEPVAVPDRQSVFTATAWAPACPQRPVPFLDHVLGTTTGDLRMDERCQRLSVTVPEGTQPGDALPVMVWIHGGSYVSGAGDVPIMDPASLVAGQRVVVVTVTYRLGLFGYLGGAEGRPANLGLLDQLEAFRWVQRNIAAFGGDPDEVTAFGQSAGGDAVAHLMATPDAPSLFRRAIIQSAPFGLSRGREAMTAAMSRAAEQVTAEMSPQEVLDLQPAVERAGSGFGLRSGMPFGTRYGRAPLPREEDIEEAWSRVAPQIDVLIGHTAEEAALFLPQVPALRPLMSLPVVGRVLSRILVAAATAVIYGRGSRRFARRHSRAGGVAHHYVIGWAAPGSPWGAAHTVDLPLLFGDEASWKNADLIGGAEWSDVDSAARQVRALWARFARGDDLGSRGVIAQVLRFRRF